MDSSLKNNDYFKKNFQLLQKTEPSLAFQLSLIDPSDLEFCWTEQHELNLKRLYKGRSFYYHSPISALKEAEDWIQSLDLHVATVIIVYGIGLGYYYEAAKAWLKQHPHHQLVFLEEDLSVLYRLCETQLGNQILKDPQVQIFWLHTDETLNYPIFNELTWTYFNTPFLVTSLKLYQEVDPDSCSKIEHEISFQFEQKKVVVNEYLQMGISFFRNFFPNLLKLPHSYSGNALFNCFSNVPAIICGAGPSLSKNIDLLPELKKHALIFAGGSALNALIPKGIIPHFGVAIDPNLPQYSRVAVAEPYSIPFFYRGRLFHEALAVIHGPRLYLTGEGGHATPKWFEKQLKIEGEDLDAGHNVVNFSIQIAQALGCNPILIIGTDLAFTNQEYYAKGIAANLKLTQEELKIHNSEDPPVLQTDIHGQPIYTLWKWITESRWISHFAETHPETKLINATEGGLGFKDVPNLSLREAADQFLTQAQIEIEKIDQKIQMHALNFIPLGRIKELMLEMKQSLDQCVRLLSKLLEENDRLANAIQQGSLFPSDLRTPQIALLESDLEEQIGYQFLLEIFSQIYIRLHHRHLQDVQSPKRRMSKEKRALSKLELEKQRYVFLRDVTQFNRDLILHTLNSSIG